jgi:hypothetical protein
MRGVRTSSSLRTRLLTAVSRGPALPWGIPPWSAARRQRPRLLATATTCAVDWGWPVLPGTPMERDGCGCRRADCATPGAHPDVPSLLAATTDPRMVAWWWGRRPDAPVLVATGGRVSAVSLPAAAGARVLEYFDALRIRTGPVLATPTRYVLLVAPYAMQELAELLIAQEWVPTSLRYHGTGGYVVLPPSRTGAGGVRWVHEPVPESPPLSSPLMPPLSDGGSTAPWLPGVGELMGALVAASAAVPDGARLAY